MILILNHFKDQIVHDFDFKINILVVILIIQSPFLYDFTQHWKWAHSIARPLVPVSFPLTHMVFLLPFWSYLAGSKSVSVRPPARAEIDDKYRS